MEKVNPAERYHVIIDASVKTKDELFSRVTDTAYLGYSLFNGWDAFNDMLIHRLRHSDILIEIANEDLSGLSDRDRAIYLSVVDDAMREFPDKLKVL